MTKEEFIDYCNNINIEITDDILNNLETYYELLVEWNKKFNMTTITKKEDVYFLHFYDSIMLSKYVDLEKEIKVCDFGTGAGFPGLVLAIFFKKINVTLIESNNKKCNFLLEVIKILNLKNVNVVNDRMEIYSKNNIEKFDLVTCRAVTSLPIILEISVQSVKINGFIAPMKANCDEEIKLANNHIGKLSIKLEKINNYTLPINNATRTIPIYIKTAKTNIKYPRNYNAILKEFKNK